MVLMEEDQSPVADFVCGLFFFFPQGHYIISLTNYLPLKPENNFLSPGGALWIGGAFFDAAQEK